ncbi:hypothetical protein ABXX67_004204 [Vibrio parahaemolyticus]|uniref:hypothetical protein n=1 Tax=Vibrio harveyi group TaxID=717610 RepID=UPI00046ED320|nr:MULTISPECIES: hypothetical protein [Vibrio harveyi group]EGR0204111.1 hypothetical protein [Vibrio parahaemolyticus]EHK0040115.1 hypothetical protein [Vibrio parahaemolyticus]EHK9063524.1 hypothetical protein [Vibrio parahaemolyticus]EHS1221472.1 hypothetical protein [Vibrio parahaemolyticus]EJT0910941.1 hypothetical protein [Vibrio parahaemolyticus]
MKWFFQKLLKLDMKGKFVIHFLVIAALGFMSYQIQNNFSYNSLKDLIDILKNASAMIFTIVGIWIAYIYPNAITAIVKPDSIDVIAGEQDARRIEMLVGIIITSAFIIIGIILFFASKSILGGLCWYSENRIWIKPFGITFILFLSYLQILSITKVIFSNIMFLNDLHSKLNQKKIEEQL